MCVKKEEGKEEGKRRACTHVYVFRGNFPEQIGGNRNARVRSLKEEKRKKKKERKKRKKKYKSRNRCPDRNSSSKRQVIENPRDTERYSFSLSLSLSRVSSFSRSCLARFATSIVKKGRKKNSPASDSYHSTSYYCSTKAPRGAGGKGGFIWPSAGRAWHVVLARTFYSLPLPLLHPRER